MDIDFFSDTTFIVYAVIIMAITVLAAVSSNRAFNRLIRHKIEDGEPDTTNYAFLKHASVAIIYLLGISLMIYVIPSLRHIAKSMLAGAGIAAVVVGFASQQALANVISGIFLVIFKPYRINDRVKIRDTFTGIIEDINLRHTVIRNFENNRIIIPNSVMGSEIIINQSHTENFICKLIEVGIAYDSDIDRARAIMQDEIARHPDFMDNRKPEEIDGGKDKVPVKVIALGDFSVTLRGWAWAKDPGAATGMQFDLLERIKKRFQEEGVEIPFPHRTLLFKNAREQRGVSDLGE